MVIKTSDRRINQFIFEVRYDPAFRLWDKAGAIWQELSQNFSDIEAIHVQPNTVNYKLSDDFQVSIEHTKLHVVWYNISKQLPDFYELCDKVLRVTCNHCGLENFNKVIGRVILRESVDDLAVGTAKLQSLGIAPKIEGDFFGIEGKLTFNDLSTKWEDDLISVMIRCNLSETKIKFTAPMELTHLYPSTESTTHHINYDAEYQTKKKVNARELVAGVWLKQVHEVLTRDLDKYLRSTYRVN